MNINGKIILITGGSKGLGRATAELLIAKGANVIITARNGEYLKQVADEIGAFPIQGDMSKEVDVIKVFEECMQQFGRLDAVINNAGLVRGRGPITESNWEDWEYVFSVNVFGAAMVGKHAAKIFKQQQYGNIVNIGSTAATKGYEGGSIYVASKFAVRGMTDCWREELRKYNVRVILINPTYVPTAFGTSDGQEKKVEDKLVKPTDIAHAIYSALAMDDKAFITELTVWATNPF